MIVKYEKEFTYPDGSIKLQGVHIIREEHGGGGRTFEVTAKEGKAGKDESTLTLEGAVHLTASDKTTVRTEQATYNRSDASIRANGAVEFSHGRLSGTGVGMVYDQNGDVLSLLAQANVHVAPDKHGKGAADIVSGKAAFARREKNVRFEDTVTIRRVGQAIDADTVVGYLSADEDHIERVELRGHSRIAMASAAAGAVQGLTATDMDLKYGADGLLLEHAVIDGDASIQLAGELKGDRKSVV